LSKESELRSNDEKLHDIRLVAEKHWEYTKLILQKAIEITEPPVDPDFLDRLLEAFHVVYVEPFVHGYKHRLEEEGIIK
jgi:hypothetical protein